MRGLGVDVMIGFRRLSYCYKLKKIYALCEIFMYTGLSLVPLLCHFILPLVALITPVLYPFAMVSAGVLPPAMASAGILFPAMASAGSW